MIYLRLFLAFFEIGAMSFGGGYGMLSLIREKVLSYGWLTESEFLNLAAISEATPGPLAINFATFIGSDQGGIPGAICATLGAVLPSFLIVLIIVALIKNILRYRGVISFLNGVKPAVVGLITGTAITMLLANVITLTSFVSIGVPDFVGLGIFVLLAAIALIYKKVFKKNISPIILLLISAAIGVIEGLLKS